MNPKKSSWKEIKQGDGYRTSRRDRICAGCAKEIKKGEKYFLVLGKPSRSFCTDSCYGQAYWREE